MGASRGNERRGAGRGLAVVWPWFNRGMTWIPGKHGKRGSKLLAAGWLPLLTMPHAGCEKKGCPQLCHMAAMLVGLGVHTPWLGVKGTAGGGGSSGSWAGGQSKPGGMHNSNAARGGGGRRQRQAGDGARSLASRALRGSPRRLSVRMGRGPGLSRGRGACGRGWGGAGGCLVVGAAPGRRAVAGLSAALYTHPSARWAHPGPRGAHLAGGRPLRGLRAQRAAAARAPGADVRHVYLKARRDGRREAPLGAGRATEDTWRAAWG